MSFTEIEQRCSNNPSGSGVTVSCRLGKRGGKPVCVIGLRATFLAASGFGDATTFRMAIGREADAGKIRIWPSSSGVFVARKAHGARIVDLGHLPSLGGRVHRARPAAVEMVAGAAVITLPLIDAAEEDGAADEAAPPPQPATAPKPVGKVLAQEPATVSAELHVKHNGVTICLAEGSERVSYKGTGVDVSPRGARLVEMLAKVMPNCIGDSHLIGKLWDKPSAQAAAGLEMVIADLKSLKKIGLEVRTQRGVGRQLMVIS